MKLTEAEAMLVVATQQKCRECGGRDIICRACLGTGLYSYVMGNDSRYAYDCLRMQWVDTSINKAKGDR